MGAVSSPGPGWLAAAESTPASIPDAASDWGTIPPAGGIDCFQATADCYRFSLGGLRPGVPHIDLEFDDTETAESFLRKLNALWDGPARGVMHDPHAWIMESVEAKDL